MADGVRAVLQSGQLGLENRFQERDRWRMSSHNGSYVGAVLRSCGVNDEGSAEHNKILRTKVCEPL